MLIVAIPCVDEDQVATVVKICVFESINVPVAMNCWVVPLAIVAPGGDKAIDASGEVWNVAEPELPS